ncbi:double-strand break repair helicase AddA [Hoeflea sp. YIM 152468]|uniref:double-strand break repair helicase AddA n=1 Tax=Hoeflea sp. YIM 152468 TaxID=3031759 RepID=UPI0023DAFF91|nr:double-strand break repair helicase AddA [Hoeflea sp. YIM 152468]MDF1610460.1 double-strand break repair helicase AddA [Hoeflea sp. YIM 152468]
MSETSSATIISDTTARQNLAATPTVSAWVSANAGSGKTHVLARRVIRLLLRGARPSAILCLTYTKAAAAEMSNRVFRTLGEWVRLDDAELAARIAELEGTAAEPQQLIRARRLFATALETPGGLKIQTIHAFCEAVLHRFPLEANIPGHFNVLDDQKAAELLAEARRQLMSAQTFKRDPDLAAAVTHVLDIGGEAGFDSLVSGLYARRRDFLAFDARARVSGGAEPLIRTALGLSPHDDETSALEALWPLDPLPVDYVRALFDYAQSAKSAARAHTFAYGLLAVGSEADPAGRMALLKQVFFTKSGSPAKLGNVASKSVLERFPDLGDRVAAAQSQIVGVFDRLARLRMLSASLTAFRLGQHYLGEFERLKTRQALLDYDDLIAATEALLSRSGASAWVHYKLDQGIDHVLVDEAQDTAPLQWNVIGALSDEFFAGEGARPALRTLFAVGDEKQSIYSFQGARPERFAQERSRVAGRARAADVDFAKVSLRVSFRSATEVLRLVDHVFADPDALRGMGSLDEPVIHETARLQAPGLVEVWPMIAREPAGNDEDWTAAFDEVPETAPAAQLARRIAGVLGRWVGHEMIEDQKTRQLRPIKPGDILVLVRKRDGFVPTLLRTLKASTDIPVAGADRLRLTDHIAVQDLMALGRFVLLTDDDLSLAAVFKSPLLGLDEDDLFNLTATRPKGMSVWQHLLERAETDTRFAQAVDKLKRWVSRGANLPPHDFYAELLGPDGGRRAYLARLGHEVSDVLDEFLGLTLDHEQAGLPGLQCFLAMLEADMPEIKREMEGQSDAVRIMTVHAAKGLEAPIVFLVDSGGEAFQHSHQPRLWLLPQQPGTPGAPTVPVWLPDKSHDNEAIAPMREIMRAQAEEEYRRLLYVGLTRAADRLVVCGYRGIREVKTPTWHSLATAGLDRAAGDTGYLIRDITHDQAGAPFEVRRYCRSRLEAAHTGTAAGVPAQSRPPVSESEITIPTSPLPAPARLPRPLAPSGVSAVLEDSGEVASRSPFGESAAGSTAALQRGSMVHRLLQVLPGVAAAERQAVLARYLARALPPEQAALAQSIETQVLGVLQDARFAPVFDAPGEAEVSVMGTLRIAGEDRAVSGRLDRIAIETDRVLIIDYKTGLAPKPGQAPPDDHVSQLAIYRALLAPLYPERRIDAALIYVSGPFLMEIPAAELDQAMARIDRPRNAADHSSVSPFEKP